MKSKQRHLAFIALFSVVLSITVFVAAVSAATDESTAQSVFEQWELTGYPDDINSVYFDRDAGTLVFIVVDPTPERIEELRALLGSDVIITRAQSGYTYNEIMRIYEEIAANVGEDSKIYRVAITNGAILGYGERANESIVVVGVDESEFNRYYAEFSERYGDVVVVQIGDPLFDYDSGRRVSPFLVLPFVLGIVIIGTLSILLWRRKHYHFSNTAQ